jgi:hypothetical protein
VFLLCHLIPASCLPFCLIPFFLSHSFLLVSFLSSCLIPFFLSPFSVFLFSHPCIILHVSLTPTRCRGGGSHPRPLRHQGLAHSFRGCRGRFSLGSTSLLAARSRLHALRGYVGWNTVRKAWEEGKVQLNDVPKGWMRTISTMTGELFPVFPTLKCSDTCRRDRDRHNAPPPAHPHVAGNFPSSQCC